MASKEPCRFALCQLPHCPWLIPCEILEKFEDIDETTDSCNAKLDIKIKDMTPLKLYAYNEGVQIIKRLVVPANAVLPYLDCDLENVHNSTDSHNAGGPVCYEFCKQTYHRRSVSKLKLKQDVVWIPRDSYKTLALMLGKIDFVGEPGFPTRHNGQLYAFVLFPNGVDFYYGEHLKEDHYPLSSVVFRIPIDELILFSDYIKFTTSVSCSGEIVAKDGVVEIMYNFDKPLSETNGSERVNRDHGGTIGNQDANEKTSEIVKHPKSSEIEDSGVTTQRSQPSSQNQGSFSQSDTNKSSKKAFSNETAYNGSNKNGTSSSSKTQVATTSKKIIKVLGNCCATYYGFLQVTADPIKVGNLVVADLTDTDIAAGEVKLICEIGNSRIIYIGCRFELPLESPRFCFEHCSSPKFFKDNCKDGLLAFIPQELFYGDSRVFNVYKTDSQKSAAQLENGKGSQFPDVDFAVESRRTGVFAATPMNYFDVNWEGSKVKVEGICGRMNSCYADVSLFAMFAFTDRFDYCLNSPATEGISEDKALVNKAICKIIKYDIISPLRTKGKVGADAMMKLRSCLSTYDKQYSASLMDAEEFMLFLLESIMSNPPFYTFNNDATDYIFQIFVTFQGNKKASASLQILLEKSFAENEVKLLDIPNPAFILKLPVCDGKPLFEMVLPNLEIELKDLLVPLEPYTEGSTKMLLRAVICLKNNHYTCFARASQGKDAFWAHFDSRPLLESPVVYWIGNLSQMLEDPEFPRTKYPAEDCETFDYLLRQAYMCIYEPSLEQKETSV